jgi:SAM-dependent methyltransferase
MTGTRIAPRAPGAEVERIVPGTRHWDLQYEEHRQRYEFAARHLRSGSRVLDAGCGVGYGAAHLAGAGAGAVIAVDRSEEAIAAARRLYGDRGIHWVCEDCQTLEQTGGQGPFDLIVNLENLEHLSEPERFLGRAAMLLAPDGVLVTSVPDRVGVNRMRGAGADAASPNPFHFHEYTADEFRRLLGGHFERVEFAYQTLDPVERIDWEPALRLLWHNPAVRAGRWIQRVVGRRLPALDDLLGPHRYRITNEDPGDSRTVTLLAVCAAPRGRVR